MEKEENKYPYLTPSCENDQLLIDRLQKRLVPLRHSGETIRFLNKGEVVGEIALPDFTKMEERHILAELAQVKEYDDFWFMKDSENIRLKASETFMDKLVLEEDIKINRGAYEGIKYQFYKNKIRCEHCGGTIYKAIFPEQKELVSKLYNK